MEKDLKVLTIGDAMITFNPGRNGPLRYVDTFYRKVGGAELNFAIGCARLGLHTSWISKLSNDDFGQVIYNFSRGEGINMNHVEFVEGYKTSLNFKEIKEDGSGKTVYYRYNSPILAFNKDEISNSIFDNIDLFHITGVFMAIDPINVELILHLVKMAKQKGVTVSFDPNLRLKLWSIEDAKDAFNEIWQYVDIVLTGLEEIELLLGTTDEAELEKFAHHYAIKDLVIKNGSKGSKAYIEQKWIESSAFKVHVVDTVGAGDGFDAAYVYSYLKGVLPSERLKIANAAGALVTTVVGDNEGLPYLGELNRFIKNEKVIER